MQSGLAKVTDVEAKVKSYNKIMQNFKQWNPKEMVQDVLLDQDYEFSKGKGIIQVVEELEGIIEDESAAKIPLSYKFVKIGNGLYPTMFKRDDDYYHIVNKQIHKFAKTDHVKIEKVLNSDIVPIHDDQSDLDSDEGSQIQEN